MIITFGSREKDITHLLKPSETAWGHAASMEARDWLKESPSVHKWPSHERQENEEKKDTQYHNVHHSTIIFGNLAKCHGIEWWGLGGS